MLNIPPPPPEKTTDVVFHLYIHIKGTSKEAEGLTVVSRKTWMHIRYTSWLPLLPPPSTHVTLLLWVTLLRGSSRRKTLRDVTNIDVCEDTLIITYIQRYSKVHLSEIIRNPQRPKFQETSFVRNIFFNMLENLHRLRTFRGFPMESKLTFPYIRRAKSLKFLCMAMDRAVLPSCYKIITNNDT